MVLTTKKMKKVLIVMAGICVSLVAIILMMAEGVK